MSENTTKMDVPKPSPLVLDIGCGDESQIEGAVGIDIVETSATDIIADVEAEGIPYAEGSVDEIYARMSFEHMDAQKLIVESRRVLKAGGKLHITVPHPFTTGFWQDWTHKIQPGFTVDGIKYLDPDHDMHYEHNLGAWDINRVEVVFWLNFSSILGRALSSVVSGIASFFDTRTREELLKLPFAGGWLEATLEKPN